MVDHPEELVEEVRHSLEAVEVNAVINDRMAALSAEILAFGNKRLNANLEWSQSLVACKDAEQAFRVHTEFFESAMRQYLNQANKVLAIMASMTGGVSAPLEEQTKESLGELNREAVSGQAPETLKPAVPIERSVTPNYIVCLEDGKKLKMLKRHLRTSYNLSPEEYRKKWGLKDDYPMVAPKYAAQRSELARKIGLGKGATGRRKGRRKAAS